MPIDYVHKRLRFIVSTRTEKKMKLLMLQLLIEKWSVMADDKHKTLSSSSAGASVEEKIRSTAATVDNKQHCACRRRTKG